MNINRTVPLSADALTGPISDESRFNPRHTSYRWTDTNVSTFFSTTLTVLGNNLPPGMAFFKKIFLHFLWIYNFKEKSFYFNVKKSECLDFNCNIWYIFQKPNDEGVPNIANILYAFHLVSWCCRVDKCQLVSITTNRHLLKHTVRGT